MGISVNGGGRSGLCLSHGSVSLCLVSRRVRVGEEEVWRGYRDEHAVADISTKPMGSFQVTSLVGSSVIIQHF